MGMTEIILIAVGVLAALAIGVLGGYRYRKHVAERKVAQAEDAVRKMIEEAQKRAQKELDEQATRQKIYERRQHSQDEEKETR